MKNTSVTICRVCGIEFVPVRFDAETCSDRCRKAKQRGHDLAYAAGLPTARRYQKAQAAHITATRKERAAARELTAVRRKHRLERLRREIRRELRDKIFREVTREIVLAANQPDPKVEQRRRGAVAAAIKHLASKGKPHDAAAIAAFLGGPYDVAVVERALAQLKDLGWHASD